jgi:hypothetical protein
MVALVWEKRAPERGLGRRTNYLMNLEPQSLHSDSVSNHLC